MATTNEVQQPESGGGEGSPVPRADAAELLKQADGLKDENMEKEEELKKLRAMLEENNGRLAGFEAEDAKRRKQYAEKYTVDYDTFVKAIEEGTGKPMSELLKAQYEKTFTDPDFEEAREGLWLNHTRMADVAASKKALDDELLVLKDKNRKLGETVDKATGVIVNARRKEEIVTTITPEQEKQALAADDSARTQHAGVNASGRTPLEPGQLMRAVPHAKELPFLRGYGFDAQVEVNASDRKDGYNPARRREPMQLYEPPVHKQFYDADTGECNFPNSARHFDASRNMFAFWCDPRVGMATKDLTSFVKLEASRNTLERKDAGDWESKRRLGTNK